jgi:hypothetical protein
MEKFIQYIAQSIQDNKFVRLTISSPQIKSQELKKVIIRLVNLKNNDVLNVTYRQQNRDITKNLTIDEGIINIKALIGNDFRTATLFTIEHDIIFEKKGDSGKIRMNSPSFQTLPERSHDKSKIRLIQPGRGRYLHRLGLAEENGNILPSAQDKYKQINRYIELLSTHLSAFAEQKKVSVADMGSGKGYLTFALYDHLTNNLNTSAEITGIEIRKELVALCNTIANEEQYHGLKFTENTIQNAKIEDIDILVALHACDTATDEAIFKGINTHAKLIVTAPCCHKQIRREIEKHRTQTDIDFIIRHGIFLERQAEMITDALRVLFLEYFGYRVKVAEFIADAHTHKNVMIIAEKVKTSSALQVNVSEKIKMIKQKFGISFHALEKLTGLTI